jgi:hypothetical protein
MSFVLDLQIVNYVGELQIVNGWDASVDHYFCGEYRILMGSEADNFDEEISGTLEIVGEPQAAPVGFTNRYLKFECLTYGVSAGLTSVFVLGNEMLPVTSCESSSSASEQECHYAFDGSITNANNGWVNHPYGSFVVDGKPSWVVFNIGKAPEVSRVGIVSGIGRKDHSITEFMLEVKTGGVYEEVSGIVFLPVGHTTVSNQQIMGNRAKCNGSDVLQIAFTPVFAVEAIKFHVFHSNDAEGDDNVILNEFYIYRAPKPPTPVPTPASTVACVGNPPGWVSAGGSDCATYFVKQYCTYTGEYGPGWESTFGHFDLWMVEGVDPGDLQRLYWLGKLGWHRLHHVLR